MPLHRRSAPKSWRLGALLAQRRAAQAFQMLAEMACGVLDVLVLLRLAVVGRSYRWRGDQGPAHGARWVFVKLAGTYAWSAGSSGADRLSTAPATAGDAQNFASSARSRTATWDSVSSPVRSTSPVTKTVRGPMISSRR